MDSSFSGFVLDPSKCSQLSMEEKRELVYEISKWSEGAPEMLKSWSRRELLEILCAEMGKERKYTGLTKYKMIEHLLRIVSEKSAKPTNSTDSGSNPPPANPQSSSKRHRKMDHPSRLAIAEGDGIPDNLTYCRNSACRASLRPQDAFCKRCSCCICHKYDDNKDPSVWLVCDSEPPYEGDSCGMSCHLECALKDERAGISKNGRSARLEGSFYCISCRKVNDLLGCWRKQLMIAKDARRVDILCYRISISHKLLSGAVKYQKLHEIVDSVMKKLEVEVGSLNGLPIKMARGIVNRLSSGAEIQKLCASAIQMLDSMAFRDVQPSPPRNVQESSSIPCIVIRFEDPSPTSVSLILGSNSPSSEEIVCYTLWHKKADSADYPKEPTSTLFRPNTIFSVSDLTPSTEYMFKIQSVSNKGELEKCEVRFTTSSTMDVVMKNSTDEARSMGPKCGSPRMNCSGLSNPSSDGDESNNKTYGDLSNSPGSYSGNCEKSGKLSDCAHKEVGGPQDMSIIVLQREESTMQEEMPGDSVSALDEERVTGEAGSEPNSTIQSESHRDSTNSTEENQASDVPKSNNDRRLKGPLLEEMSINYESNVAIMEVVPFRSFESTLPVTPCKLEMVGRMKPISSEPENRPTRPEKDPQAGSSSKKRSFGRFEETCDRDGSVERNYEYCVKVVRWLECEGHVEKNFRVKFLTWFSLRASPQERRIVSVYVDTLIDDPASLAGQLVDTFSEGIYNKRPLPVTTGFCMKLWH
ncbi:VIN3-like protein 2 [Magnolia sinica]|uniref:VIN3-like protein 2 n=1 Tax=Magnolia sinica TaxID=86752 RepID=UPI0026584277|nr:VIN3-like protein 2 [Magnolia sinica]